MVLFVGVFGVFVVVCLFVVVIVDVVVDIFFARYGALSFGEVVQWVPQKLESVPAASVRRLAVREAAKVHCLLTFLSAL